MLDGISGVHNFFIGACSTTRLLMVLVLLSLHRKQRFACVNIARACPPGCITGPVGSIIYADLYGSIKIKFTVLIRDTDQ